MPPPSASLDRYAPPCVLLDRYVDFEDEEDFAGGAGKGAATICGSRGEASLEKVLVPSTVVVYPPEVSSLSVTRYLPKYLRQGIDSGTVSSTHKGLVVLYTGMYRPGDGAYSEPGCYLVYDASRRSSCFSAIPQLDQRPVSPTISIRSLGTSAAILRLRDGAADGAYLLAELVTTVYPGLPDAYLYLWSSSSKAASNPDGGCGWRRTRVRLPLPTELCGLTPFFHIDMAFAFGDSCVCWADLLAGVLICDLFAPEGPEFTFVPLPKDCCSYTRDKDRLSINAEEFSSMGCVCGAIQFVAFVGYPQGLPKAEVALKTWTLSPNFKEWKEGPCVLVCDLWESDSFRKMKLPERGWPINPALSLNEDGIIYMSLCDMEFVEAYDFYGQYTGRQLKLYGHYVLQLDLLRNKILYSRKITTKKLSLLTRVVASDFSAYLYGGAEKDSQRGKEAIEEEATEEEAIEVGTMVKRTRTKY